MPDPPADPEPPAGDPLEGWLLDYEDSSDEEDPSDDEQSDEGSDAPLRDPPPTERSDSRMRESGSSDAEAPPPVSAAARGTRGAPVGTHAAAGGDSRASWGNGLPFKVRR